MPEIASIFRPKKGELDFYDRFCDSSKDQLIACAPSAANRDNRTELSKLL